MSVSKRSSLLLVGLLTTCNCLTNGGSAASAALIIGEDGAVGEWYIPPDFHGGDGGNGESILFTPLEPYNEARGGIGGQGGNGIPSMGNGGNGGSASATASISAKAIGGRGGNAPWYGGSGTNSPGNGGAGGNADATAAGYNSVQAEAIGGSAGYGSPNGNYLTAGVAGFGSLGSSAEASAIAVASSSSSGASADSTATAGDGGPGVPAGFGGLANSSGSASSVYGGHVQVVATQIAGAGGGSGIELDDEGDVYAVGVGGLGAESLMFNQVGGFSQMPQGGSVPGTVSLTQIAKAGAGGSGGTFTPSESSPVFASPGAAGNATSTINHFSTHGEATYFAETEAWGGAGGSSYGTQIATPGGQATASATLQADSLASPDTHISTQAEAFGLSGGNNTTIDGYSGIAGQGGKAEAHAYSGAIDGGATATATAMGGAGGNATVGESGIAGTGGTAIAEASALTITGTACAESTAIGGAGGNGGVGGGGLGGVAFAEATVTAGGVTLSSYDAASDGGTAHAQICLTAPENGVTTVPGVISRLLIDSPTSHTVSRSGGGAITFGKETGVEISASGGIHVINSPVIFIDNTTVSVENTTDTLILDGTATFTPDIELTKTGAGELAFSEDIDISEIDLRLVLGSGAFNPNNPQLAVTGSAEIGGSLDMDLVDSFVPSVGDKFNILEYTGSLTGKFNEVQFPLVEDLSFGIRYLTGAIEMHVALQGDLDDDGFVGLDDLSIVLDSWNTSADAGVLSQGDPSGNGYVSLDDLDIVLDNWNAGVPPSVSGAIPEPSTLMMLGILVLGTYKRAKI